ncbi:MAG: sulfite exporter TauE/SafE family protein [Pseudomonadota bacterium]
METLFGPDWPLFLLFASGVAVFAGMVKGVVGFAMPMVFISMLSMLIAPELALAGLILPTLVTNLWQALRQGFDAAFRSMAKFRVFLLSGLVFMVGAAQLVTRISEAAMLLIIGVPVVIYASLTLAGRPLRLPSNPGKGVEIAIGAVAGFFGGISGVWGPPTVALLMALNTEKTEQMRTQGVIYGTGAVVLTLSHLSSGVLNATTIPFSLALILPGALGMWIGLKIQDRIDQQLFRRLTLVVLVLMGLNLVRRGLLTI